MAYRDVNPEQVFLDVIGGNAHGDLRDFEALFSSAEMHAWRLQQLHEAEDFLARDIRRAHEQWDEPIARNRSVATSQGSETAKLTFGLASKTVAGFLEGTVSPEELIYVGSLVAVDSHKDEAKIVDFDRAANTYNRFKRLQPGCRFLTWSGVANPTESTWASSRVNLIRAGIVADAPVVSYTGSGDTRSIESETSITVPLKDGSEVGFNFAEDTVAIGDKEIGRVVDIWHQERQLERNGGQSKKDRLLAVFQGLNLLNKLDLSSSSLTLLRHEATRNLIELSTENPYAAVPVAYNVGTVLSTETLVKVVANIIRSSEVSPRTHSDLIYAVAETIHQGVRYMPSDSEQNKFFIDAGNRISAALSKN